MDQKMILRGSSCRGMQANGLKLMSHSINIVDRHTV